MRAGFAFLFLLLLCGGPALALEQPDLVFEVRLDGRLLSDAMPAYQEGSEVYLPLGELARLLTIAIRCEPDGRASGYILDEQRGFFLDAAAGAVTVNGRREDVAASSLLRKPDDIYVAASVLARWLPVDLAVDMPNLMLRVTAREQLPVQARLERQSRRPGGGARPRSDPGYERVDTPYALLDAPFIDQTVSLDLHPGANSGSYRAYAAGDLLGMEAALYLGVDQERGSDARLSVGRHDPDARLLGFLRARTAVVGSVSAPAIAHVAPGSSDGTGFTLSNRPLSQAALLDRHSLRGDLPPGWDVELFYNDALVGFQQSRGDGKYAFEDLPLNYGPNEFRLVFHGPLGQLKVERHSFLLEDALLAPGELVYHLTSQRSSAGGDRSVATFDVGLGARMTASASLMELRHKRFTGLALHGYWDFVIASATLVRADDGGRLAELAVRTRVAGMAVSASRAHAQRFVSDIYSGGTNPIRMRDELRVDGPVGGVHMAMQARRDRRTLGDETRDLSLRTSAFRFGSALSHVLRWRADPTGRRAEGALQVSRRVAGIGMAGQALYEIRPEPGLSSLSLSVDKRLWPGYLLNLGVARSYADEQTRVSAALNKSLGRFGLGLGAFATSRGDIGATVQLFTSLGREPRRALWAMDAVPMAASGAASVLVFVDRNRNGVMDDLDEPVKGAGFELNGGLHAARTGEDGVAWLGRLTANQHLDIAVDAGTLEDPQWQPQRAGMRIVPRAGKVSQLAFAVGITAEIDGTTYLLERGARRPIGDVELQLLDAAGRVAGSATSGADGYYIIAGVVPGRYRLRVSPEQLARLGMCVAPQYPEAVDVTVGEDGAFVNGKDLVIARLPVADAAAAR